MNSGRSYPRSLRVGKQIQRDLSAIIQHDIKDLALSTPPTISSVEVSSDLSVAKVYLLLDRQAPEALTLEALDRASGYIRRTLASRLRMRAMPILKFHIDRSAQQGEAISQLIDNALKADRQDS